ncbi:MULTISPECIES: hypothetical protein [unclassified Rhizobacter]|uniref:hypothetical protein n=1 Tax=unclassified Rhizobacter TaxID=2640088 RepID=UPI000B2602D0|nr:MULTISPECIES: hypothetical protein [unclassified Rhizobacter]
MRPISLSTGSSSTRSKDGSAPIKVSAASGVSDTRTLAKQHPALQEVIGDDPACRDRIADPGWTEPVFSQLTSNEVVLRDRLIAFLEQHDLDDDGHAVNRVADIKITALDGILSFKRLNAPTSDDPAARDFDFHSNPTEEKNLLDFTRMILQKSGQLEYMATNIEHLANADWQVVLTLEYVTKRSSSLTFLHKDGPSDGKYVFSNLVYLNSLETLSFEYIPDESFDVGATALPFTLKDELRERQAKTPSDYLKCQRISPDAVVSWCDSLLVHSTPLRRSRKVDGQVVKEKYLSELAKSHGPSGAKYLFNAAHEKMKVNPSTIEANSQTEKMGRIAVLLASAEQFYPDELQAAGVSDSIIESMFENPIDAYYASEYTQYNSDLTSGELVTIPRHKAGRLKRELSEGLLADEVSKRYTSVRPSFMNLVVQILPADSTQL